MQVSLAHTKAPNCIFLPEASIAKNATQGLFHRFLPCAWEWDLHKLLIIRGFIEINL